MSSSDVGWYQRIESELFNRYTELRELTFVCFDHVGVSLTDLLELSLYFFDSFVFKVFHLFECALYYTKSFRVYLCSS